MSKKNNYNPKVKPGDKIILLSMVGEPMPIGLKGTVLRISNFIGSEIIQVDWENGRNLSLLADEDIWMIDEPKKISENSNSRDKWWSQNIDIFQFNTSKINQYLIKIAESGIVNMFGASPYLYLGKERIEHEFKYNDLKDDDKFEEVLDMADEIQSIMVGGVMKILEKEGKELSLDNINNYLRKYSQKLLMHYINVLS
jgi:hypothetical protein